MLRELSRAKKDSLDEELFEYNNIAYLIALRKTEIETQREHDENVGGGRSSRISKPVEDLVLKFSSDPRILILEKLRRDIDNCYLVLTEEQRQIFDYRWILDEGNTWEEIAHKMHFSRKSIYRKRAKILEKYAKIKGEL